MGEAAPSLRSHVYCTSPAPREVISPMNRNSCGQRPSHLCGLTTLSLTGLLTPGTARAAEATSSRRVKRERDIGPPRVRIRAPSRCADDINSRPSRPRSLQPGALTPHPPLRGTLSRRERALVGLARLDELFERPQIFLNLAGRIFAENLRDRGADDTGGGIVSKLDLHFCPLAVCGREVHRAGVADVRTLD